MLFVNWKKNEEFQKKIVISIFLKKYLNYTFINYCEDYLFFALEDSKKVLISLFGYNIKKIEKYINFDYKCLHIYYFDGNNFTKYEKHLKEEKEINEVYIKYFSKDFENEYQYYINDTIRYLKTEFNEMNKINQRLFEEYFTADEYYLKKENLLLYQYRSDTSQVINLFINNHLSYNNPAKFNDPFDCDMETLSVNEFMYIINKILKNKYLNLLKQIVKKNEELLDSYLDEKKYQELFDFLESEILTPSSQKNYLFDEYLIKEFYGILNDYINLKEKFRVLCVTKKYDNILMWSYYANSHEGICFEHNFNNICNGTKMKFINGICFYGEVEYSEIRPQIKIKAAKYHDDLSLASMVNNNIKLLFTKYKGWIHEEEYRFVVLSNNITSDFENINTSVLKYYLGCNYKKNLILPNKVPQIKMTKDNLNYKLNKI